MAAAAYYAAAAMAASARRAAPGQAGWPQWAARARGWASSLPGWGYWALAAGMLVVYGAWPGGFWDKPKDLPPFSMGMIWQPNTGVVYFLKHGDRPALPEYHWHGAQLVYGNAFVLGGLVLLGILVVLAWIAPAPRPTLAAPGTLAQQPQAAAPASGLMTPADVDITSRLARRQHPPGPLEGSA